LSWSRTSTISPSTRTAPSTSRTGSSPAMHRDPRTGLTEPGRPFRSRWGLIPFCVDELNRFRPCPGCPLLVQVQRLHDKGM
jgi:hypothetical protein